WQDSCFCMTYGDGAGNAKPLTSLDVAAHEMTHGLTSVTAKLVYSGESGGLNEATSDILAAAVEFHENNAADKGDYLIGEKIDINGNGTPLRYMDKPSRDGKSKDSWYSGIGSVDVHY
ncbi:peptidase M4, partial [Streptomyces sp. NRRL F-6602]